MNRRVLMVAYHFPPMSVSSGYQRTWKFARYLPEARWTPVVLTVNPSAYPAVSPRGVSEPPADMIVARAACLDVARQLSIGGRYPDWTALPDRWASWIVGGLLKGWQLTRQHRPSVIWSTYPIATAHLLGYLLARLTQLPWVTDFRDPMCQEGYPENRRQWRAFSWIERRAIERSALAVFTAPSARDLYARRYPHVPSSRLVLLPNGYDEEDFGALPRAVRTTSTASHPLVVLHSGTVYPSERDPRPLFRALAELKTSGKIPPGSLRVILRATGHDELYRPILRDLGIDDVVELAPAVGYQESLEEMASADALLLLQADNCNYQIPAKVYEYFRAGRPVIALTDPSGDTAAVMRENGVHAVAPLEESDEIARKLPAALEAVREGRFVVPEISRVRRYSRRSRTLELAALLDRVSDHCVSRNKSRKTKA